MRKPSTLAVVVPICLEKYGELLILFSVLVKLRTPRSSMLRTWSKLYFVSKIVKTLRIFL